MDETVGGREGGRGASLEKRQMQIDATCAARNAPAEERVARVADVVVAGAAELLGERLLEVEAGEAARRRRERRSDGRARHVARVAVHVQRRARVEAVPARRGSERRRRRWRRERRTRRWRWRWRWGGGRGLIPAEPKEEGADDLEGRRVPLEGGGVLEAAEARAEDRRADERRPAARHVHDARARKVDDATENLRHTTRTGAHARGTRVSGRR